MNCLRIGIVGSGPAGFIAGTKLLDKLPNVKIDMYEKLPVPFGLVRYGIAPDHVDAKNILNKFHQSAKHPNFNFYGNVSVGTDIGLKELKEAYHILILTYGASEDKKLGIAGENLDNVISARELVEWYNGHPNAQALNPTFSGKTLSILGQGNVALDIVRMLFTPIDILKTTEITQQALEKLSSSNIKTINLIGRRGPLQIACTTKEFRHILTGLNIHSKWRESDFENITDDVVSKLERPRRRLTELMLKTIKQPIKSDKVLAPIFYRAPINISKTSVKFAKTLLTPENQAINTNEIEYIESDLVVRSIGYTSTNIDASFLPFDDVKCRVDNKNGVTSIPGIYTCGWAGFGSVGVILTTTMNSNSIAGKIIDDVKSNPSLFANTKPGSEYILKQVGNKKVVTWDDWLKIDQFEIEWGKQLGKCREKVTDVNKMLKIVS